MASSASKLHLSGKKHSCSLCCQHEDPRALFRLPYLQNRHLCFPSPHRSAQKSCHFLVLTLKYSHRNSCIYEASHTLLLLVSSDKPQNREEVTTENTWLCQAGSAPVPALSSPRGFCAWHQAPVPHPSDT